MLYICTVAVIYLKGLGRSDIGFWGGFGFWGNLGNIIVGFRALRVLGFNLGFPVLGVASSSGVIRMWDFRFGDENMIPRSGCTCNRDSKSASAQRFLGAWDSGRET